MGKGDGELLVSVIPARPEGSPLGGKPESSVRAKHMKTVSKYINKIKYLI
jgi:hypothetical protein